MHINPIFGFLVIFCYSICIIHGFGPGMRSSIDNRGKDARINDVSNPVKTFADRIFQIKETNSSTFRKYFGNFQNEQNKTNYVNKLIFNTVAAQRFSRPLGQCSYSPLYTEICLPIGGSRDCVNFVRFLDNFRQLRLMYYKGMKF